MNLPEGLLRFFGLIFGWLFGWPLGVFRRWLDRQPDRGPSQISRLERFGRPALGGILDAVRPDPAGLVDLQVKTERVAA